MVERDKQASESLDQIPKPLSMLCGPGLYQPTLENKLRACKTALEVLPRVLPQEQWASTFHLWHDDLHEENIFVHADDPSEVVAVIDWQSTFIAPLFDHTMIPGFLDHDGPAMLGMERPTLPKLSEDTSADERAASRKMHEEQTLICGFKHLLQNNIRPAFDALMYEESVDSDVVNASRNLFEIGEAYCMGSIAALKMPPVPFSAAEQKRIGEDVQKTVASMHVMNVIKKSLGDLFLEKGVVRENQYEDTKAALRKVKEQVITDFSKLPEDRRAWEEAWPFDD